VPSFPPTWRTFHLHRLILARSPFFKRVLPSLSLNSPEFNLELSIADQAIITPESFSITVGYLYSPVSAQHLNGDNAISVLAAAYLLGSDDLCRLAWERAAQSVSLSNVAKLWQQLGDENDRYGSYGVDLRQRCFRFVCMDAPMLVHVSSSPTPSDINNARNGGENGRVALLELLALLPFRGLKRVIESVELRVGSEMERYQMAKECVALRKARGGEEDESVLLAFEKGRGRVTLVKRRVKRRGREDKKVESVAKKLSPPSSPSLPLPP